jgi:holo-[acyl-carrier protein] synthase
MIIGVGIDIIEVERVEKKIGHENGFREKIFSASEIAFCESKINKGQHYAARFAAKEAFLKATGKGLTLGFELNRIEIQLDPAGKPGIVLAGSLLEKSVEGKWNKIHLSLSHLQSTACAVVIIEQ